MNEVAIMVDDQGWKVEGGIDGLAETYLENQSDRRLPCRSVVGRFVE